MYHFYLWAHYDNCNKCIIGIKHAFIEIKKKCQRNLLIAWGKFKPN